MFAEHAVILANVILDGQNKGQHLFWSRIATRGSKGATGLAHEKGVTVTSLPAKTSLLNLDNAFIEFDHFRVSRQDLLCRFSRCMLYMCT
jgi:hypothetical protein